MARLPRVPGVAERRVAHESWGPEDGEPVLLCHGGMFSRLLRPVDLTVLGNVRLLTFDRPGYGGTDPLPGATVAERAADGVTVLDACGVSSCRVVGWSNGVPHALALAAIAPERVTRVDAVATPVVDGFQAENQHTAPVLADPEGFAELVAAAVEAGDPVEAIDRYSATMSYLAARDDEALRTHLVEALREGIRQGGVGAATDQIAVAHPWGFDLASVHTPVRVWFGADDTVSSRDDSERLTAMLPSATLTVVPGGHDVIFALWNRLLSS